MSASSSLQPESLRLRQGFYDPLSRLSLEGAPRRLAPEEPVRLLHVPKSGMTSLCRELGASLARVPRKGASLTLACARSAPTGYIGCTGGWAFEERHEHCAESCLPEARRTSESAFVSSIVREPHARAVETVWRLIPPHNVCAIRTACGTHPHALYMSPSGASTC